MVILVSDLHLADTVNRATINVRQFLRQIKSVVKRASDSGTKNIYLVLLGDIFEILKSEQWQQQEVRPWEAVTTKHVDTVDSIFTAIVNCNEEFFEGVRTLLTSSSSEMHLEYIPGNHDRPLNTGMGIRARAKLRELIVPPYTGGQEFNEHFISEEYELIAKHGHEWDPVNRYGPESAAIGDAIVIDMLLRLPLLVSQKLQLDYCDPNLEFLHELDNVRPHSPSVMAQWILNGLTAIKEKHSNAHRAFQESCEEVIEDFQVLQERTRQEHILFEAFDTATWWLNLLTKIIAASVNRLGALNIANHVPSFNEELTPYGEMAVNDIEGQSSIGTDYRYVVCGHTHDPVIVPLNISNRQAGRACVYLNTGTWRRVHKVASTVRSPDVPTAFSSWDEECVISIYNKEEQRSLGHPAYEFHRLTRGAYI